MKNSRQLQRIKGFAQEKGIAIEVAEFEQDGQAVQALLAGQIDALTTGQGILLGLQQENPSLMILLEQNFSNDPYGLGIRSGDSYFADLVNYTLQEMKSDGTYDELYKKWFCAIVTRACISYPIELWPGASPYTFTTAPTVTVELPRPSVVDKIIKDGFFVAGLKYDTPPFGYVNENGELGGFEVELMYEFARRWLGDANAVQFAQVTSSDRITKIVESDIDIIAATMTHTKNRDANIDFSQTYYLDGQNVLVRRDAALRSDTDAARIQALDGVRIGAIKGSTAINRIRTLADEYGITIEIVEFEQYGQPIQALLDGAIDGVTTDRGILSGFAQRYPALVLLLDNNFSTEPYGLGLPQGDHRFRDLVNFTLQEMKEDGTYDQLYRYWFGINYIMQDQTLSDEERYDTIRRYWTDDVQNPVNMTLTRESWQPYPIEIWPGVNYFTGTGVSGEVYNDLAPMSLVPAGPSLLGTTSDRTQDISQHPGRGKEQLIVEIDPFYIDQHEVTNHQYRQCVNLGKCTLPQKLGVLDTPEYFYADRYQDHPVVNVTWEQAQQYCTVFGKTLPTEAQWEKAARFTADVTDNTQYMYPWGDSAEGIERRATYANSAYRQELTNPVGTYRYDIPAAIHGFTEPIISLSGASSLGVLDMAGNVQEWTADCYSQGFYQQLANGSQGVIRNPNACDSGQSTDRTVRSSGYYDPEYTLTTVFRQGKPSNSYDAMRGFRCVASAENGPTTRLYSVQN